jgi:PIN domain nuclease of toxin-antitoxin system
LTRTFGYGGLTTTPTSRLFHLGRLLEEPQIAVSAISVWEISLLERKGRLNIEVVSIDEGIALEANSLPDPFHEDPADRIIVATARRLNCELMTYDAKIGAYPHVKLIS